MYLAFPEIRAHDLDVASAVLYCFSYSKAMQHSLPISFIVSIYRIGKRGAMKLLFGSPALLLLLFIDLGQLTC